MRKDNNLYIDLYIYKDVLKAVCNREIELRSVWGMYMFICTLFIFGDVLCGRINGGLKKRRKRKTTQ